MSDLAQLRLWDDPAIRDALSWYLDVAENRRPAKFRIAATIATQLDPALSSEDALCAELERLTPSFLGRWREVRRGARLPRVADGPSLLELCRELAYRMLAHCNFCPWNCRVDRVVGTKFGACKLASGSRVSSHFHHTRTSSVLLAGSCPRDVPKSFSANCCRRSFWKPAISEETRKLMHEHNLLLD
jgi:putative pyruvate formate lyase activating enzyme